MSRIGKQPINIPSGVEVKLDGSQIIVKGPENKKQRSLWGLFRRLISNMIFGVTEGFSKKLEINGIGYKAQVSGENLVLQLGYSHPINFLIPKGIEIKTEKNAVNIFGSDKELVGNVAAEIRALRKPEPYKGKGIKYAAETIRRKAGKAAAKT